MPKQSRTKPIGGYNLMTEEQRGKIVRRIAELSVKTKPTWQDVIDIALTVTRKEYSRQGLYNIDEIEKAFQLRVAQHRHYLETGSKPVTRKLPEEENPKDRLHRETKEELEKAKETIRLQDERLVRLIANASAQGLDITLLDQKLPKPERKTTDPEVRPIR